MDKAQVVNTGIRPRTLNEKRGIVKDHITGKTASYKDVLNGELDKLK